MKFLNILNSHIAFYILLAANFIIGCLVFYFFRDTISGDHFTYLGLAEGIKRGVYSYWYFLDYYTPDTFRTPGYPLFVWVFKLFTENVFIIKIAQLLLYFASVGLILSCLKIYNRNYFLRNIFLLLLLPSVQIVHYSAYIFPEILMVFLLNLFIYLNVKLKPSLKKALLIGIVFGLAFQVRPIFLFFPFLFTLINVIFLKSYIPVKYSLISLFLYCLTLIPFASWNYLNHGVFKVTSLEGGGGILHLGFWQHKLPNYYDERYWTTYYGSEMVRFINENERERMISSYNKEWDYIDSVCAPYLSETDRARLPEMEKHEELFKTYGTAYTLKREEVLKKLTIEHILKEPLYYIKVKAYSAIRLFVTGINPDALKIASGLKGKVMIFYPTLITGLLFFSSVLLIPLAFFKTGLNRILILSPLCLVFYYWIIHIPMSIQSRYTIPIQMILIYILAIALFELIKTRRPLITD